MVTVVGIRGAIVARQNSKQAIIEASTELLEQLIRTNDLTEDAIAGIFFTSTADLTAAFPAAALREIGWSRVVALCAQELEVPDTMQRVIQTMVFANRPLDSKVKHQYIGEAARLRSDRASREVTPLGENDDDRRHEE